MKQQILLTAVTLSLGMGLFGVGCAKGNSAINSPAVVNVTTPPGTTSPPGTNSTGVTSGNSTAVFVPESLTVMNTYVATHPLNSPTNYSLNVSLSDIGSGRFAGTVTFSYTDNGQTYIGSFTSGTGTNQVSYHDLDLGKSEAEFNQWFTFNGARVFHGFFQDQYGAIIVVVDSAGSNGDGGAPSEVSGSVWFKNFPPTYAQQSPEKCWFIRTGPFDCRAFVGGNDVIDTTSALYPGNGYTKLGRFSGLNYKSAFNLN